MDFSNFWWEAASTGPGPQPDPGDPGDPIANSLRFRGAQWLKRTFGTPTIQNTWSWSCWVKKANTTEQQCVFGTDEVSRPTMVYCIPDQSWRVHAADSLTTVPGLSRDPSAWEHLVVTYETPAFRFYINGVLQVSSDVTIGSGSTQFTNPMNRAVGHTIGAIGSNNSSPFEGHMAQVFFIDGGQALDPTTFGRFNANGVWVPVEPQGLTYGANGFHLTFADLDDVGKDYSGNDNHFTATGFDTSSYVTGYWVDGVSKAVAGEVPNSQGNAYWIDVDPVTAHLSYSRNAPYMQRLHDGDLTTEVYWTGSNSSYGNVKSATFDLRDYPSITDVAVYHGGISSGSGTYECELLDATKTAIPGTQTVLASYGDSSTYGWRNIPVSGTPRYLRFYPTVWGNNIRLRMTSIRINGKVLSMSPQTGTTYDLMQDSPTQNWALLNAAVKGVSLSKFDNANLTAYSTSGAYTPLYSTFCMPRSGKWYVERYISAFCGVGVQLASSIGINTGTAVPSGGNPSVMYRSLGGSGAGIGLDGVHNAGGTLPNEFKTSAQGKVARIMFDLDVTPPTITVELQGVSASADFTAGLIDANEDYVVYFQNNVSATQDINFGQLPFTYGPPAGFEPLQTQNMPKALILDGREHFQAITGPGQGADGATAGQLGGNWSKDIYTTVSVTGSADVNTADFATTELKEFRAGFGPELGFNGSSASNNGVLSTPGACVFRPEVPIQNVTRVEGVTWASQTIWVNGDVTVTNSNNSGQLIYDGPAIELETLAMCENGRGQGGWYTLQVSINGGALQTLVDFGILSLAQQTFPNGLWWIKDRANSNQHQLVDSVRGGDLALQSPASGAKTAYVPPAGDSVAWCWNSGGNTQSDTSTSNPLDYQVNVNAGFEIQYTQNPGDLVSTSVLPHHLGEAPEFIIFKADTGNFFFTYHKDANAPSGTHQSGYLALNNTSAFTSSGIYFTTAPTNTTYDPGTTFAGGGWSGARFAAYLWRSVPGYSAFGTYTGNGNVDGPFVYTGHKSAWVMCKAADGISSWFIWDATRDINNPADMTLYSDLTAGEDTGVSTIDILSNGFKFRQTGTNMNIAGRTYIYASFAQHPFQSPATAR